jgi:hypothetical protein
LLGQEDVHLKVRASVGWADTPFFSALRNPNWTPTYSLLTLCAIRFRFRQHYSKNAGRHLSEDKPSNLTGTMCAAPMMCPSDTQTCCDKTMTGMKPCCALPYVPLATFGPPSATSHLSSPSFILY